MSDATISDAVSVSYAREQYALGYFHGRSTAPVDERAAGAFARFYARQCARADRPVNVQLAHRQWLDERAAAEAELRYERALDYASNYEDD